MDLFVDIIKEDMAVRRINLPISILNNCRSKSELLSVAVSVFIKSHYGDSRIVGTNIRSIKSFFGVGQEKARKISNIIKNNSEYFSYNRRNDSVIARTFKNKMKHTQDKYGRRISMMYVVGLDIHKDWNLKKVEVYIHDMLYLNAVNATERSDKYYNCREIKNGLLLTTKDALTLTKMGNIGGVCRSTAKRHLERIERERKISIKHGYLQVALVTSNEDEVMDCGLENVKAVYDAKRGISYLFVPNSYSIIKRSITDSFRNIIYNHRKRWTENTPTKKVYIMDTELMAKFR